MKATIVNFRGSRRTKYDNHMVLYVDGVTKKDEATKLIGKSVSWKSSAGKEIKGTVSNAHGNKGAIRVIFEKGMPGQAIGTVVSVQ